MALDRAVEELREVQLDPLKQDLLKAEEADLDVAEFTVHQLEFKRDTAVRAMDEALAPTTTGWLPPTLIVRAIAKIKVVLGSIKSLSKWVEALAELVDMVGEIAKNRLRPLAE